MKVLGTQVGRWASVILGIATLGALAAAPSAHAAEADRTVQEAPSGGASGAIVAVFLAAAVLVALWRVLLWLIAVAFVGVLLLGVLVLVTGGSPGDERPSGAAPLGTHGVVLEARGPSW
ncbi:hypothetical protein PHK61_30530 [Actinomycetospora lutea]|uniref:hypothetical protein n=1 Tax=Actinomycetospora lutea TaxID=663604 RepID=UPI0023667F66|nr:hypothetical protein [Actinomycetospora lutea]MDD7942759.1 hypothetical protein [Actinomycetospora lutea]